MERDSGVAVVADGLDRATFEGLAAERDVFLGGRLLVDERVAALIVPREKRGRGFATKIAVDALLIDVEFTRYVAFPLVGFCSHDVDSKSPGGGSCQATS